MRNVGRADRIVRVAAGAGLLSMLLVVEGPWKYAGLLGVPLLLSGLAGICWMYRLLKVNTCPVKRP
ncbi:MAG: hypothetical protein K0Q94_1296 [Paenibacillus sp.]|jgi:hypothetical protein|uniref:YgaP family membrane protein n=1 Tax=Paenibacillus sp. GCM10012303 TaxID=3317340 RepID=UPI0029E8C4F9|nr:hypothetical protein [Paenibacillus sp.]